MSERVSYSWASHVPPACTQTVLSLIWPGLGYITYSRLLHGINLDSSPSRLANMAWAKLFASTTVLTKFRLLHGINLNNGPSSLGLGLWLLASTTIAFSLDFYLNWETLEERAIQSNLSYTALSPEFCIV